MKYIYLCMAILSALLPWECFAADSDTVALLRFFEAENCPFIEGDAQTCLQMAACQIHDKQYIRAMELIDKAIEKNPRMHDAWEMRGAVHLILGSCDAAVADMNNAVKAAPECELALLLRGVAYMKLSEIGKAIDDFDQAIRIYRRFHEAYIYRGKAHYLKGEYRLALADFDMAIKLRSDNTYTYLEWTDAYAFLYKMIGQEAR